MVRDLRYQSSASSSRPATWAVAELVVAGRHAGPVPEFFFDGQGLAVPVLGLVQPPPVLGGHAELVVDDGDVGALQSVSG